MILIASGLNHRLLEVAHALAAAGNTEIVLLMDELEEQTQSLDQLVLENLPEMALSLAQIGWVRPLLIRECEVPIDPAQSGRLDSHVQRAASAPVAQWEYG